MRILNAVEKEAFDAPPEFNAAQRKQYFDLSIALQQANSSLRSPTNRLCFLVSCGYFKAAKQFFSPIVFNRRDKELVAARMNIAFDDIVVSEYDKQTAIRHHQLILKYYGFREYDRKARSYLSQEIAAMVQSQLKPRFIFWRCVDLLVQQKIQVPPYFRLAEICQWK